MPLDIVTTGADFSPASYCDRATGKPIVSMPDVNFCTHRFTQAADGQLEHWMNDTLRAVIPPEGWDDYALYWPACAGLVEQMKIKN